MSTKKQRPGRNLEKVIASLERSLGRTGGVKVESPKRLPDLVTGKLREHDVVVTYPSIHHEIVLAIECRDRHRKVTVNDVEGFSSKCRDTNVHKGVMVSPRGFWKTAITKAKRFGIACLSLQQVDSFPWLLAPGVRSQNRKILKVAWTLHPERDQAPQPTSFSVVGSNGQLIPREAMREAALSELKQLPAGQLKAGRGHIKIAFKTPGIFLREDATGTLHPVDKAMADIEYEMSEEFIPFNLIKYSNSETGSLVTDAAVADITIGAHRGELMIVFKPDEGGQVVFVPTPKGDG